MRYEFRTMMFAVLGIAAIVFWPGASAALPTEPGSPAALVQEQSPGAAADASSSGKIENSVVKVFATLRPPDLSKPWSKQTGNEVTASGVVIEGRRILTIAHVVQYAGQVQIQGYQSGDKISATVESVAPGIDLAVLKLSDESFFDSHAALPRSEGLPRIKDSVMVYGFPTGGNSISITKGIVSRIDFVPYTSVMGLRVQIDAAINPGNSGGPAVVGEKMIGVVFSILANTQNIGYIIPWEEINLFLKDVADGRYDGKPGIFDAFQTLENPALREFLKLDKAVEGIVVHQPLYADSSYPLRKWDVVTKIGDSPVDNQGAILYGENLKIMFTSLVQTAARDGKVPLTIVRDGREMSIQLPVEPARPKLIPFLEGKYPSYFICGPMVFSVAVEDLIAAVARGPNGMTMMHMLSLNSNPMLARRGDRPAFEGEELVVIASPFFAHALARNYSSPVLRIVQSINGVAIKNLRHLVETIRDSRDEFIVIDFAGRGLETLVFPRQEMITATEEILNDNGIRTLGSPDVLDVWNAKPR